MHERLKGCGLDAASVARLESYVALLQRWSRRHNLVSFRSEAELLQRQVLEVLPALEEFNGSGVLVDVGSGAGFPGVPLLAVRPQWKGVLLEPRQKRWAFLRTVVRELGVDAEVVRMRYQDWRWDDPVDRVVSRAVGGWEEMLGWAEGALAREGSVVLWIGSEDAGKLARRLEGWHMLSSPLMGLERGTVTFFRRCFT